MKQCFDVAESFSHGDIAANAIAIAFTKRHLYFVQKIAMPVSAAIVKSVASVRFRNATEMDQWFIQHKGDDFLDWFNAHVAKRLFWGKSGSRAALSILNDTHGHDRFQQLWSAASIQAMFDSDKVSFIQFLALQSIIINETGGLLLPVTERVGSAGHPGIAYAFDRIPNLKKSYNTLPGNKTCLTLFNDAVYNKAFDQLPLAAPLKNTRNQVWAGETYPQTIATSTNPQLNGYVQEADFFKFRGRGFIQTTGRVNYQNLIDFVLAFNGTCNTVLNVRDQWKKISTASDILATVSTNAQWDDLFQKGECLVAGKAISLHNHAAGNYLLKLKNATGDGIWPAVFNMGKCISGSTAYAALFQNRVEQIFNSL